MKISKQTSFSFAGLILLGMTSIAQASVSGQAQNASQVIENRMTSNKPVPKWVSKQGTCIAALKTVKVGFIWGGEGSTGMVSCRKGNAWSEPSFFTVGGVNFGLQIGIQFLESVMVFITDDAKEILSRSSFEIGTDVSFAAGPVGEGIGSLPNVEILSYEFSKGLYVGATIDGFIISPDDRMNRNAYGHDVDPSELFEVDGSAAPGSVQSFVKSMNKYFPQ